MSHVMLIFNIFVSLATQISISSTIIASLNQMNEYLRLILHKICCLVFTFYIVIFTYYKSTGKKRKLGEYIGNEVS